MKSCSVCKGRGFTVIYAACGEKEAEQCMWCNYE